MCIKSNTTIEPTTSDVYLSFEDNSSITITFYDPTAGITGVSATGNPEGRGPTPEQVSATSIKFFDPDGAEVDFTINATYSNESMSATSDPYPGPIDTPTIAVLKPRTTCPPT